MVNVIAICAVKLGGLYPLVMNTGFHMENPLATNLTICYGSHGPHKYMIYLFGNGVFPAIVTIIVYSSLFSNIDIDDIILLLGSI
jgi:hypothetical protein